MFQRALEHMYKFDMSVMNKDNTGIFPDSHERNNYGTELPNANSPTQYGTDWTSKLDNLAKTSNGESLYDYQDQNFFNPGFTSTWSNTGEFQAIAMGNSNLYLPPVLGSTHAAHLAANAVFNPEYVPSLWVQDQSVPCVDRMIGGVGFHGESHITDLAVANGNEKGMPQQLSMGALVTNFQPGMCLTAKTDNVTNTQRVLMAT